MEARQPGPWNRRDDLLPIDVDAVITATNGGGPRAWSASGNGPGALHEAADKLMLELDNLGDVTQALVCIKASRDLGLFEVNGILNRIASFFHPQVEVDFGATVDESFGGGAQISVLASEPLPVS